MRSDVEKRWLSLESCTEMDVKYGSGQIHFAASV